MTGVEYGAPGLPRHEEEQRLGLEFQFPENTWFSPWGQGPSAQTAVVGVYQAGVFWVPAPCTLIGLGIQISSAPSNDAVLKLGIHDHDRRLWMPSRQLFASPEITGAPLTAGSPQSVTGLSVRLRRGLYWAGYIFTAGTTLTSAIRSAFGGTLTQNFPGCVIYGPQGSATPSVSTGNDGSAAFQTGAGDVPGVFAGINANDGNGPHTHATMFFLTTQGRP